MNEIKALKYQWAVIPEYAIDNQVETLDFGDASREIACIAIDMLDSNVRVAATCVNLYLHVLG